jgi:hypothetical protein
MSADKHFKGKGSKQRPIKDQKQFDNNWDRIFGKKKTKDDKDKSKSS